ncbi:hypothetical protein SAMN05414137_104392 [Streptacidiphilus jiangxiensis]|uniref:Uncharacterized protein n=1 Tax=Streptacidiphilus jiangxiensis TaxID=235985 RepID=A0A1H7L915_STRJI|nr:hypothetical protein SAMN05414137_104392 [Streptacidiphilus jiangxiensis]
MRSQRKRVLGVLAAAGMLLGLGATPAGAAPTYIGKQHHIYSKLYGVPTSERTGSTFYANAWYMQDSSEVLGALGYRLSLWSPSAGTDRGFSVSWLNPQTHKWQTSSRTDFEGSILWISLPLGLPMAPHRWYKIELNHRGEGRPCRHLARERGRGRLHRAQRDAGTGHGRGQRPRPAAARAPLRLSRGRHPGARSPVRVSGRRFSS